MGQLRAQPKKVLFVLHSLAVGGMETFAIDLAGEMARRSIAVSVVFPEAPEFDVLEQRFTAAGCTVVRLSTDHHGSRFEQLKALRGFVGYVRSLKPDVVHIHTGGAAGGLAVVLMVKMFTKAQLVLTEHSIPDENPPRYHKLGRPFLDWRLDALVCVSRRNARMRAERIGEHAPNFASILNGIPVPEDLPAVRVQARRRIREQHGIAADALVIGCLVRMAHDKGIDDLIRAFALLDKDARLLLVGDGPLRAQFETLAVEKGVGDTVIFAGFQTDTESYLAAFDIFALAVPSGSMSIALLEAMGHGVPSLITFCGPEEAIIPGVSGYCAPPNDPVGLAAALRAAGDDPEDRQRISVGSREHVDRHFSITRVADDYLVVYRTPRSASLPEYLRWDGPPTPYPGHHEPVEL